MIQRLGKIKCAVSRSPMSQQNVSILTSSQNVSILNVLLLLPLAVEIRVQNSVQCCRGIYRRILSFSSPQSMGKYTQETDVHGERGNKALRKLENRPITVN